MWNGPRVRAVIVEDEQLARQKLRDLLSEHKDIDVVAECSSGIDALRVIDTERPDLVFLDVQMRDVDGFGVLDGLRSAHVTPVPLTIFTTAHDRYAIKAFEHHAFDYLLKPFGPERFRAVLNRVRERLHNERSGDLQQHTEELLNSFRRTVTQDRMVVKSNGRFVFLQASEIVWLEAEGNYIRIHLANGSHLIRESMNRMEARLDPNFFIRVHRSWIVNITHVREIRSSVEEAEGAITLRNGTRLALSRGYRARIETLLVRDAVG